MRSARVATVRVGPTALELERGARGDGQRPEGVAGAALGVSAWALGSSFYDWGYASYGNPYYAESVAAQPIVIEQTAYGGEPQTVSVPGLAYDYSQPIDAQAAPPHVRK